MRGWAEAVNIRFTVHMGIQAFRNYQRCLCIPHNTKGGGGDCLTQLEFVNNPPVEGCWWSVPSITVWVIKWNQSCSIQRTANTGIEASNCRIDLHEHPPDVKVRRSFTATTCLTWCEWFHRSHATRDDFVFFPSSRSVQVPWEMLQSRESC